MKSILKIASLAMLMVGVKVNAQTQEKIKTNLGDKSDFIYTEGNLSLGTQLYTGSIFNLLKTPSETEAHLFLGNPTSETISGQVSSRLTFAGNGIQHAGLAWVPSTSNSYGDGKLFLGFGAHQNPMKNSLKVTFQSNGNVGIGTTSPEAKLDVHGNIYMQNNAARGSSHLKIFRGTEGRDAATISFGENGNQNWFFGHLYYGGNLSSDLYISKASAIYNGTGTLVHTPEFTVRDNGNVGIGVLSPSAKLDVNGNMKVTAPGSTWITGKTGTGGITSSTQLVANTYHPLIRQKTSSGHYVNLGGLGDIFGFFGYDKDRVENGYDHSMVMNLSTGNIGIGVLSPTAKLDVNGNIKVAAPGSSWITGKTGTGGISSSTQLTSNAYHSLIRQKTSSGHVINLGGLGDYFGFFGYDKNRVENGYDHSMVMNLNTGNVSIGTRTTGSHKLAVEGSIGAREIKVEAFPNWSDFVFEKNYELPTLAEVESHIKEKGHLKDIPSADEVAKEGFYLGAMDAKLLQKIEELTLYTIQQQKELEALKKENKEVKEINLKLEEVLKRLDNLEQKK